MQTLKGPAIFLAQFAGDEAPFNSLNDIAAWAAGLGYKGIQIPSWDARLFDLDQAAESKSYCEDLQAILAEHGLQVTELSTHLQGQLVAVHPAYDEAFDGFAAPEVRGNPAARQAWAVEQMHKAARASANLGLENHASFPGALAWPYVYPWPQRPPGLVETAFDELARRWHPILDAFDDAGVNVCFEIHPGEDLHDGITFEMFLERVKGQEMMVSIYVGFAAVAGASIFWVMMPLRNPELVMPLGGEGLRHTIVVADYYAGVLDRFGAIQIGKGFIPTGLLAFWLLLCGAMGLFLRTRVGIAMSSAGARPSPGSKVSSTWLGPNSTSSERSGRAARRSGRRATGTSNAGSQRPHPGRSARGGGAGPGLTRPRPPSSGPRSAP